MWLPSRQPYLLISLPILNITCGGAGEVCSTNSPPPIWMNHIFKPENSGLNLKFTRWALKSCFIVQASDVLLCICRFTRAIKATWSHELMTSHQDKRWMSEWEISSLNPFCYNRDIPEHTEFNNFCFGTNFSTKFSHQLTLLYSKHFLKPKPVRQADGSHHSRSLIEESWSSFSSLSHQ